ncbi:MAG: MBL fold metallo-hydrolase [Candidatus Staskawiczbacteria bacterium CG10_big_fil_rev_8_21_14_0_10_38_10]|uniref:MBL fold metallo-hydrolase n=1 Tax=Candidatus Staskawiczbacteria bacterium CG10_big_fil_rev_8_21_14_0_10_38_10 TaxID=1974891 RepID=A0A2H9T1I4_9BACT|nr:MAG: MBL fold metallo-hydrolase [Candidatus Staskawiczbacteria bacterium CG10_big_fil_rev_8_21_14_0_10_38_10]
MAKITWAGQSCFQINFSSAKNGSINIVIDPFDETIGLKPPSFPADILLVTHDHHDHNNVKAVKGEPFVIKGPGEYEVKGVHINGILAFHDDQQGKEKGENVIYVIEAEDMKICHLGDLGQRQLTDEQLEKIGSVDILMIPVGGTFTISAKEAQKIISQIEPKIVIPMHYLLPKLKVKLDDVDKFSKVMGKNSMEAQDKFSVKASVLPKEGMEIVILKP